MKIRYDLIGCGVLWLGITILPCIEWKPVSIELYLTASSMATLQIFMSAFERKDK